MDSTVFMYSREQTLSMKVRGQPGICDLIPTETQRLYRGSRGARIVLLPTHLRLFKEPQKRKMKFEDILEEIDGFGPFQINMLVAFSLSRIVLPCNYLLNNFIGVLPPHHCDISTLDNGQFGNLTEQQRLTVNIPVQEDGSPKSCEMFAEPQFQLLANISNSSDLPTVHCGSGWVYDNSTFTSTIATEWDLVCGRKSLTKTTTTIFFIGLMTGGIIFGYLSDKYGRRTNLFISYIMATVFGFSSAFSGSFVLLAALRFLTGVGLAGTVNISIVLSIEWVDSSHRSFNSVIGGLTWSFGNMLLAGLAFLIRDWRTLVMTVTAPLGLSLCMWWWIPESARWLLANGKVDRAQVLLDRCAEFNKRPKPSSNMILETLSNMNIVEKKTKQYSYLDLIKTPKLRQLTLITGTVWFGIALTYYGISLNISGFGLNMYLTHFIYAAIEIPAKLITYFLLNIIGRRWCQAGTLLLTATCIAINIFVPQGLWYVRAAVAILGKGLSEASFTTVYLYIPELYPTVLRQNGMGFTTFMCRLGVSLAPLILLLGDVWTPLPHIIFCSAATTCGLLPLLLPETLNKKLPETIDDIEKPRILVHTGAYWCTRSSNTDWMKWVIHRSARGLTLHGNRNPQEQDLRTPLLSLQGAIIMVKVTFESILEDINGFGPFQITIIILLYTPRMVLPGHFLLNNFIGVLPPHHCDISTLNNGPFRNLTEQQRLTVSIPVQEDGSPKSCEMFAEPQFQLLANTSNSSDLPTVHCGSGWVYDNSTFTSTIATEWDLVCDRKSLTKTSTTIFFTGVMVGSVAFGYVSDKYGRRLSLFSSYLVAVVFGFSSTLANSFILFVVLRFLTGFGLAGIIISTIVLSLEWVNIGHRSFSSVIGSLTWSIGNMLLAGLALLIKDWRMLVMTVTAPVGLALLTWWWIPESARWLLVNGHVERAKFYLDRCAKFNKRPKLSPDLILETFSNMEISERQNRNYSYLDLFKSLKLRKLAVVTGTMWFGIALTYYGISLNVSGFGLNMYLTHFIYAAIEVPAKLMTYCLVNTIGRRRYQAGTILLTGVCIAINMFVPTGLWLVRAVVATLGKGLSEASVTAFYLYTPELYPTVVRQNGLGFTCFMCRLGVSLAPLTLLLEDVWTPLPQLIICSITIVCGLLPLLLPETLNKKLPETIEDIEKPREVEFMTPEESPGLRNPTASHTGAVTDHRHQEVLSVSTTPS
ncbi:uncharacterized protein [Antennarius striatus]|uniref:uncharacterized protein n=1 Tax=Antennarius striatus TaxID=241820 RepID=UPI0035B423F3